MFIIVLIAPCLLNAQYIPFVGGWYCDSIDKGIEDVGYWSSIAIDKFNNPHISYYDATNGDLRYIRPVLNTDTIIDTTNKNLIFQNGWII